MLRWAKITEEIGADEKLCGLAERNTMAALLFTWSLPKVDVYAIMPGSATEYRARVCPGMDITKAEVQKCIYAQVEAGLLYPYSENGKQLLYIVNFHKHQSIKWGRVGQPVNNLPPCWRLPQELRQYMEEEDCDRQPAFYGLTDALEPKSRTTPGLVMDYSGENALDVDSDVDSDVEADTEAEVEEPLAAIAAGSEVEEPDDGPEQPPLPETAPEKKPRKETEVQRVIRECWEMLDLGDMPKGKGNLKGYSGLTELFKADGWEVIEQAVKKAFVTKPQPTGNANPWAFFCKQFNLAVNRPWEFEPQQSGGSRAAAGGGRGPIPPSDFKEIDRNPDGSVKV